MRRFLALRGALCAAITLVASCAWSGGGETGRTPGAPVGVTAAAGSATSVHVMWTAADRSVEVYEVYRGTTKVREVPGSEHMVDVTRLRPSTMYVFTVRARDGDGRLGPPSAEVRATTPAAATADGSAPTTPRKPTGKVIGSRAVQLSWGASSDDRGVMSYDVLQGGTKIHSVGGNQTATVVTGLRPGTGYAFTVRARDAADNVSPASGAVRLTTAPGTDDGRGTAPTGFRAATRQGGDGAYYLDLAWVPPRADGVVTEYQVHLDGRAATSLVFGGDAPRDRATYSFFVGREAGVGLRVRIRAKLPDGTWGGFSPERTVTTGGATP
ncbi:fibronectin type III domain-containing protein [Streptomyces sp. S.PB5]|uniref:fibronectin type III domain-containing protein n=1 Tax=Streptomyces sp. S.PB5 TaxID=3020844 RepID=UPI0025B19C73|nr:fibronectin type III domain-containing protein [Streptomyces sp. S.PB5]MDN3024216.1 fibronectin type III domain-containing protein [Streptomyces sp. S.PB5]